MTDKIGPSDVEGLVELQTQITRADNRLGPLGRGLTPDEEIIRDLCNAAADYTEELLGEIDALQSRLLKAEAERDEAINGWNETDENLAEERWRSKDLQSRLLKAVEGLKGARTALACMADYSKPADDELGQCTVNHIDALLRSIEEASDGVVEPRELTPDETRLIERALSRHVQVIEEVPEPSRSKTGEAE